MYVPEFDKIHYQEVVLYLEEKWGRRLTEHEVNVGLEFYRYGRHTEIENRYINEAVKCNKNTF